MATYTDNYNLIKPSYSEIADVATINTNMNTIDDIMHSTQISLAPAYDSTKTYNIDDVVMYELLMYKCKENGVTGTWNASKWERTTASATGGGGGGGSSLKVDKAVELYGYIMASSGTFTLNDSIDNYDVITFIYGIAQNREEMSIQNIYVKDLKYLCLNSEAVFLVGYGSRYIKLKIEGDTLTITGRGGDNTPVIYRVIGHKQVDYIAGAPNINVVAYGRGRNVNTTTIWTASRAGKYLVANINCNSDGGNKTLASGITSTGTIYDSWNSTGESGADTRCYNMTWALVDMGVGDTITLDRSSEGSYSVQSYGIYELINVSESLITDEFVAMTPDNVLSGTYTLIPSNASGHYIAFAYVTKAVSTEDLAYADFTVADNGDVSVKAGTYPYPDLSNLIIDLAYNADTFTFKASNVNGYVTKGYGLLRLN